MTNQTNTKAELGPQKLADVATPALILDLPKLDRNIARMADRCRALGVALRPHVKTPKSLPVAARLAAAGASGFTVSTLQEAEYLAEAGYRDIFYAVPIDPRKVARAAELVRAGVSLSLLTDSLAAACATAEAARECGVRLTMWIEIDVDHYRTGIEPSHPDFEVLARFISDESSLSFGGLMSYGGASYNCVDPQAAAALTEGHRRALVESRQRLGRIGIDCPGLSFGSTPAVLHAHNLTGVTEARCGIYAFQDLFQAGIGACEQSDIALSVLTTVIGADPGLNRFTVDAGGLALSKDRSTQGRPFDAGFGLVCNEKGEILPGLHVATVSQELGLVTTIDGSPIAFDQFPVGTHLRILPNHADMTAAAYEDYWVAQDGDQIVDRWQRTNRW